MGAALALEFEHRITLKEYLEGEEFSEVRHEYFDGRVFAMAGASANHEAVAGNLFSALHHHMRGKPCKVFKDGMKLRLDLRDKDLFYYPDIMVTCDPLDKNAHFRRHPNLIIEVLSADENKDLVEKFFAYQRIKSLQEYVVIRPELDNREIFIFRQGSDWDKPEIITEGTLELKSIDFSMSVDEVFEGVE